MEKALATTHLAPEGVVPVFTDTDRTAVAAMELLRRFVRSLPLVAVNVDHIALRRLVAWYERVWVDERYMGRPPADGMNALLTTEYERSAATAKGFVAARWAVRVAEEVVNLRSALARCEGEQALSVAQTRLDLALQVALERLGTTA